MAWRMMASWRGRAIWLRMTPRMGTWGSKCWQPKHHGGGGAGPHGAVHHQHHRGGQELGQLRGAIGALGVEAVVEAPVAFDQEGIRLGGMTGHRSQNLVPLHEEGVQIMAGASRRQAVPGRVDIVGALLEGHQSTALVPPGGQKPQRQGGLAGPAPKSCQQQPGTGLMHQCLAAPSSWGISMKLPPK